MIKNAIIIMGMHRSGTSSLTRVMSLLGAGLPKTLLGQNEGNQRGHWESEAIIKAHDIMLSDMGSDWTDFRPLALAKRKAAKARFIGEAADMVMAEYGESETIVIKEPRICRFADSYIAAVQSVAAKVHVMIPSRNPLEVAASLQKRDGMSETHALFLWLSHMIGAEQGSRGQSRSFVDYADYLDAPLAQTQRLVGGLPFALPYGVEAMKSQIERYVEPGLKRQSARDEDVAQHALARGWVDTVYRALQMLAADPDDAAAKAQIDGVAAAFFPAAETLWVLCQDAAARDKAHAQALADKGAALSALAEDHAKAWKQSEAEASAQITALKAKFEAALTEANTTLAARDAQISQIQDDLTASQAEQSRLGDALEDSAQRESALNEAISALNRDIKALVAERAALWGERDALTAERESVVADKMVLQAAGEHHQNTVKQLESAVQTLQTERGFLQDEFDALLQKAEGDLAAAHHALFESHQQADGLRETLDAVMSSTSWRMTKSLRAVMNRLRGKGQAALPEPTPPPRLEHKEP